MKSHYVQDLFMSCIYFYRSRVLDHDTYSSHDSIGKVYIDLNPLLMREHGTMISGWFPIYDTMHGIRGELSVIVKVDLFSDFNKFRQSSCGVHFFCSKFFLKKIHSLHLENGYHVDTAEGQMCFRNIKKRNLP